MKKNVIAAIVFLTLFVALVVTLLLRPTQQEMLGLEPATTILMPTQTDCDARGKSCAATLGQYRLNIKIGETIKTLQPFSLSIEADGWHPQQLAVYFSMVGMEMGLNRFRLQQTGNLWQGQAMLPLCTQQRNDWLATVFVTHNGERYRAEFGFSTQ